MLWAQAIADGDGLAPATVGLALTVLPGQLAVAFRGVLPFWTAGEFGDVGLASRAREAACAPLLGFVDDSRRSTVLVELRALRGGSEA